MKSTNKKQYQLPEEFSSYEKAGEFWDTHDSTNYREDMTPVKVDVRLDRRHFEIDIDEEIVRALELQAHSEHIPAAKLANDLLRRELILKGDKNEVYC